MTGNAPPKIVYILPEYDPATGSHFFHLYELLIRASDHLDIFLVIERTRVTTREFPFPCYSQRFRFAPVRFAELLVVLFCARISGRRFFYSHYTLFGAVASWAVTALFGGKAYYWNAGMPWLYSRSHLAEFVFRFVLRHTVLVTASSKLASQYSSRYGLSPAAVCIMPNWIHGQRFRDGPSRLEARRSLAIPEGAEVILFLHRLSRRKGVHFLPDIISGVLKRRNHAIFLIVGSGPEREWLAAEISRHRLEAQVRMIGEVPHQHVRDYFFAADIFLMPSEEEGFPHVLLEAMAAGIPYVASDVGAVGEMTPPELAPYLVSRASPPAFTERVLDLIFLSPAEKEGLAQREGKWVRQYDLANVLPKFVGLFV